jgi:ABC-type oligopeptide transport system substrate-binding subunit
MEAAKLADSRTLYEIITKIYAENGITPSNKTSDWTAQKAVLLHKAELILMQDLPVIPVLFNQNAVIVSDQITNVTSTYYIPAYFRKTNLKDYENYTYVDNKGETVSIFAEFPTIAWDKIGK